MHTLKVFVTAFVVFLILDYIWLGWLGQSFYSKYVGSLMRTTPEGAKTFIVYSALIVYFLLVAGILVFALPKANGSALLALFYGGLFGLVTYGIYDFTNHAVLQDWPLAIALIDTSWGIVLCALVNLAAFYGDRLFS